MPTELPPYAERLAALHDGLHVEFKAIIGRIPALNGARIVDAGCGDGFFTRLLADHVGSGRAEALDALPAYLEAAGETLRDLIAAKRVRLVEGDVLKLPFEPESIDVVLSAHSMQSYDDLPAVLTEFRRVLRPGGVLAILETDALHSIILPWPPRLEIAIRHAERQQLADADDRMGAYFPRYARRLLDDGGFEEFQMQHIACDKPAPLSEALAKYCRRYIAELLEKTGDDLTEQLRQEAREFAALFAPGKGGADFLSLQTLITARRP